MNKECHAIVLWSVNNNLLQEIREYFKDNLKYAQAFKADQYIRYDLIKTIYKHDRNNYVNDSKMFIISDIIVCIVEVNNNYGSLNNRKNCNLDIASFKEEKRNKYSYIDFHTSDNQKEFQYIIEAFSKL